jgi:hypothetical protein
MVKIYRNIIFPVLYGCESWLLTLRAVCRLRLFENVVLRRIFWPKKNKVAGDWRKLCNEELNDLYSSPNIVLVIKSRRMRWVGQVMHKVEGRGVYRIFVGKPEGKRPMGRPKHRWDVITVDIFRLICSLWLICLLLLGKGVWFWLRGLHARWFCMIF